MNTAEGETLFRRLDYRFSEFTLYLQSLTHKSYVNENAAEAPADNERMEFLGDAVLDFVVTELIMERYTQLSEGELSKLRAALVSEPTLAAMARRLELGEHLRLGRGEELSGGRDKSSILADALEALIAAVYLDSKESAGIREVTRVVRGLFRERNEQASGPLRFTDYKTELQELAQKRFKERATYKVMAEEGPDHDKQYEVAVFIQQREYGRGRGRSKKESEQAAAKQALHDHFGEPSAAP